VDFWQVGAKCGRYPGQATGLRSKSASKSFKNPVPKSDKSGNYGKVFGFTAVELFVRRFYSIMPLYVR
jgi:hypothetical protein